MSTLQTKNLNFKYGLSGFGIDNINLQIPENSIYGLIGPNGNGKSTTIKTCLDLLEKDSGEVLFFDKNFDTNREVILQQVGCLLDQEGFYPQLNARDNLEIIRLIKNLPKQDLDNIFKLLELDKFGNKKVKSYSTGMKQKLAIAMAIIGNPKLIILDEPMNGLDPEVVVQMRNLLLDLNKQGSTIIISSHILSELEKIVTDVGIIKNGKLLLQGKIEDITGNHKFSLEEIYLKTIA
jgi:ABC-2 type transport system ATP-binding protein